jgi:glycosyltransferase involved in cell wall biosynthesis
MTGHVYLIGSRYKHHSCHSGYEGFGRYVGTPLKPAVHFGPMTSYWGWRVDNTLASLVSRPYYTLSALLTEGSAFLRMVRCPRGLFHVIYGDTDLWLLPKLSRLTKTRLMATFHQPASTLGFMAVEKNLVNNLTAVILVAEAQRIFFQKLVAPDKIFVVPHGVDTEFFHPAPQLASSPTCITVGSHLRDFDTLKASMKLIWRTNPDVRLIAIGTRRSKESKQRFRCDDDRITFLENLSDEELLQNYQKARVALFSFKDVTASNAILEAMACGIPIVATEVGGVMDYVDSNTGLLFKAGSSKGLSTGVLAFLNDAALAGRASRACRLRALAFDYRIIAEKMSRIYSDVLGRN